MDQLLDWKQTISGILDNEIKRGDVLVDYLKDNVDLMMKFSEESMSFMEFHDGVVTNTRKCVDLLVKQIKERESGLGNESQGEQIPAQPAGEPVQ